MRLSTIIALAAVLFSASAQAMSAPSSMISGSSSFLGQGLGRSCYAFDLPADTLPCNPAFIAKERERRFNASIYLGNNISYFKEASDLASGRSDQESIRSLFEQRRNDDLHAKVELGFWGETIGWSMTPLQVHYVTDFQNQALPEIDVYASLEESARVQLGSYFSDDWSAGIQFRYVRRRFVANRFFLTEALVPDGKKVFAHREQNMLYIEPGILYAPEGNDWRPESSIALMNFGFADRTYTEIPLNPQVHFTTSVSPDLVYGRLGLGIDMAWDKDMAKALDPFTLGSYYEFGILRIFGSLARQSQSIGFGVFNAWWNTGIVHSIRSIEDAFGESESRKKTYLFLGVEL